MSSSRFVKADAAPSPLSGPFAPVLTGVSRGLQDLFPPVALPQPAGDTRQAERDAVAPVLRQRPGPAAARLRLTAERALPQDEPEPEIDHRRGLRLAVEEPEQQPAGPPADLGGLDRDGGEARHALAADLDIAEAEDLHVLRHPEAAAPALHQGAEGRDVGDEEYGLGAAAAQEFGHRLGAMREGARRPSVMQDQIVREPRLGEAVAKTPQPLLAAKVADIPRPLRPEPGDAGGAQTDERPRGEPADLVVGESHGPVDRRLGPVPDLHHRHAGAGEEVAGRGGMLHARHHDRVRAARQHRAHHHLLLAEGVAGHADQGLVAARAQRPGEAGGGVGEVRVGQRGDDQGDEAGAPRRQSPGAAIRHVAEPLHRRQHPRPRLLRDEAGLAERARDRHRRDAGKARHVAHRRRPAHGHPVHGHGGT